MGAQDPKANEGGTRREWATARPAEFELGNFFLIDRGLAQPPRVLARLSGSGLARPPPPRATEDAPPPQSDSPLPASTNVFRVYFVFSFFMSILRTPTFETSLCGL